MTNKHIILRIGFNAISLNECKYFVTHIFIRRIDVILLLQKNFELSKDFSIFLVCFFNNIHKVLFINMGIVRDKLMYRGIIC